MTQQEVTDKTLELEKVVLQALCQPSGAMCWQQEVISRLSKYKFRSIHNQVLFDCLKKIPRHRPEIFEELLHERLIRAGFPDMEVKPYLEPSEVNKSKALAWAAKLSEAS